jgi:hypothetical protein
MNMGDKNGNYRLGIVCLIWCIAQVRSNQPYHTYQNQFPRGLMKEICHDGPETQQGELARVF